MGSGSGALYLGVTNNLSRRVMEHKLTSVETSFSAQYHCYKLLYFEQHASSREAIAREKQIKRWRREKKTALIASINPEWDDLWLRFEE